MTKIETSVGGGVAAWQVTTVEVEIEPTAAVIVAVPAARQSTVSLVVAFVRAAMSEFEEVQTAVPETFCWVPSLNVPVATKLMEELTVTVGFRGVMAIDCKLAEQVIVEDPLFVPMVAVMVLVPADAQLVRCWVVVRVPIGATAELLVVQVEDVVTSLLDPSLNVPVAMKPISVPTEIEGFTGVTEIETRLGAVHVRLAVPTIEPTVAETVAVPAVRQLKD